MKRLLQRDMRLATSSSPFRRFVSYQNTLRQHPSRDSHSQKWRYHHHYRLLVPVFLMPIQLRIFQKYYLNWFKHVSRSISYSSSHRHGSWTM